MGMSSAGGMGRAPSPASAGRIILNPMGCHISPNKNILLICQLKAAILPIRIAIILITNLILYRHAPRGNQAYHNRYPGKQQHLFPGGGGKPPGHFAGFFVIAVTILWYPGLYVLLCRLQEFIHRPNVILVT